MMTQLLPEALYSYAGPFDGDANMGLLGVDVQFRRIHTINHLFHELTVSRTLSLHPRSGRHLGLHSVDGLPAVIGPDRRRHSISLLFSLLFFSSSYLQLQPPFPPSRSALPSSFGERPVPLTRSHLLPPTLPSFS